MESAAELRINGDRVIKRHAIGTDPGALQARLDVAVRNPCFVPPLRHRVECLADGRVQTEWPKVPVLTHADNDLPWAAAGALLARLHRAEAPPVLPRHGWPARLARAMARAPESLAGLGRRLADEADRSEPAVLVHGDWHPGQLGLWSDGWRLLDVDDVGLGDPAWDLARPAGFWAAGLLPDADWQAFLDGYRRGQGPAVPSTADPWPALDLPARCAVFVAAVRELGTSTPAPNRFTADALVAACLRMAP